MIRLKNSRKFSKERTIPLSKEPDWMQIGELIRIGVAELTSAGVVDCVHDVHLLLGHCLGKSRTQLLASAREEVRQPGILEFSHLLERRKKREPVAYILGEQEFWSLPFVVNSNVLIPRPETEYLLEKVLTQIELEGCPDGQILDLCCGSGVIGAVLALELRRRVTAVDISLEALGVTKYNCVRHGVDNLVRLVRSDLFSGLAFSGDVPLVVSNPPYVSRSAIESELEPEVAGYEPSLALDGGEEGMDLIVRIRHDIPRVLMPGGHLFMEIGFDQGAAVSASLKGSVDGLRDFSKVDIIQDLAGKDRILHAVLKVR